MSSPATRPEARISRASHPRYDQMYPVLASAELERIRRFGQLRTFSDGEPLILTGQPAAGMFVILKGHVCVTQRDGLGLVTPLVEDGPGQFLAEVGTLSAQPSPVDAHAEGEVEVLLIPSDKVRALLVAEADLGERIIRAMILRRVGLIETKAGGPVLFGPDHSPAIARLKNFLTRNGQPFHHIDSLGEGAAAVAARFGADPADLPLVITADGSVLRNPSETELGRRLGMDNGRRRELYDVAIVGCGPAGLATAVYAASEGLSVIVLESRAFGGQAGASARIENYLGFPTGISGQALTGRAYVQAQKFGAEVVIPAEALRLDCSKTDGAFAIDTASEERIRARAVVVASGARYRRPQIERLADFEGKGVWYWASPTEAQLCAGEDVVLVGGGNSAGQAAVFLSGHARKVRMMVRGAGLADSMSRYLIDRIQAASNIELMTCTEVSGLDGGDDGLQRVRWRNRITDDESEAEIQHLFLFVGADPATEWLEGCGVAVDKAGFVTTGKACAQAGRADAGLLESSVPGVFAVGDVRSGSVKRVGGAIGEGAQVVAAIHAHFAAEAVQP